MLDDCFVLTGGPCVGKTTLIAELSGLGHRVVHEMATEVILEGQTLPLVSPAAFRKEVLNRQLKAEKNLPAGGRVVFLDRGAYDGVAYCVATGVEVHSFLQSVESVRYRLVFVLEGPDFWVNDGVRYEDPGFTRTITPVLLRVYRDKGAKVVPVPFMPVEERLAFILAEVNRLQH
jgi:predicted ATPase